MKNIKDFKTYNKINEKLKTHDENLDKILEDIKLRMTEKYPIPESLIDIFENRIDFIDEELKKASIDNDELDYLINTYERIIFELLEEKNMLNAK